MTINSVSEEIRKMNKEHAEKFVQYGAESKEFRDYEKTYDKQVMQLKKKLEGEYRINE